MLTSSYYIVCAWMNFVSARRKKGKVKYTKILKKRGFGRIQTRIQICLHIQWLEQRNEHFKKYACIFILTYVIATIFLFLKHTLKGEPKANLSIASI